MKTKKDILEALATIAPSIAVETLWEHDPDARWDVQNPDMDPDDYQAWQSEVRASCICNGRMMTGNHYLGGTWEKYGDNPEISGYFPQMVLEAIENLAMRLADPGVRDGAAYLETVKALNYLRA
jgi:hypothetical protein